jgi:hypothetical protein
MSWSGPEGGRISVGFDDDHFGLEEMQTEMDFMREAHPSLPDKVPGDEHRVLQGEHGTPLGPVQGERYPLQERDRMGPAPFVEHRAPDRPANTPGTLLERSEPSHRIQ